MKQTALLWSGILGGPVVWLINLEASFALVPAACAVHNRIALYAVSLVSMLLIAASGLLAWSQYSRIGAGGVAGVDEAVDRSRSMALGGMALSALFLLVVLAQSIPNVLLMECG
jgi:hypothetical protein